MPESLTLATEFGPASRWRAQAARLRSRIPPWLLPSYVDLFFLVLVGTVFGRPGGWQSLLADGDTGWHIRTGELVLRSGGVPFADVYSFSRAGAPWIAWEWLSDVLFAVVYGWRGTGGVAAMSGVVLCLAATALLARVLRRGCGLAIGLGVTMAVVSASSIHYLARPHVFSILFYTLALWALDEDRRCRCWRVWLLVPATILWANLHAGFVALPATAGLLAAVCAARLQWRDACRYATLGLLCFGAGLVNPYGPRLYAHVFSYLRSPWILDQVQEFRSPSIRSEETVVFAVFLLAGAAMASRSFSRGEWFDGVLALAWGFAAMRSARHIAFYMVAAAPLIAAETARIWREWAGRSSPASIRRTSWRLSADLGAVSHGSIWLAIAAAAVMLWAGAGAVFSEGRFPVRAVERNPGLFGGPSGAGRILTSDQWADYLIFRLYPSQRVFFDGRSDFYGPALIADYRRLQNAAPGWRGTLESYRFHAALMPREWPLNEVLAEEPGWSKLYQDSVAALFVRKEGDH